VGNRDDLILTEMFVRTVGVDITGRPLIILADEDERRLLPIWIGHFEAQAIAVGLREEPLERPFTHDLLHTVIGELGHAVDRVVVSDLKDGTYYATVVLANGGERRDIDARPSDAIALALRAKAPIFVADSVLDVAGVSKDTSQEPFKQLMSGLRFEEGRKRKPSAGEGAPRARDDEEPGTGEPTEES
jgi:hypothetical protein